MLNFDDEITAKWLKFKVCQLNPWRETSLEAIEEEKIFRLMILIGFFSNNTYKKKMSEFLPL